nr:disease resistance protein RPP13-like isoform X6 [Ipomoea batatas]
MEWNGINVLCKLPRLEVLKLLSNACVGKEWELPEDDDKFGQLIVLEIGKTDLKDWKATGDHFPKLKHLSLSSCKELKEIPRGFAEIEELKSIQLAGCRPSVVASAEEIKEEQLDYLNNIVDVVVAEQQDCKKILARGQALIEKNLVRFLRFAGVECEKRPTSNSQFNVIVVNGNPCSGSSAIYHHRSGIEVETLEPNGVGAVGPPKSYAVAHDRGKTKE